MKDLKPYSNNRMFIEYIFIVFLGYLLVSLVISTIGGYTYRSVLSSEGHFFGILFVYWWLPIPRMLDMQKYNRNLGIFLASYLSMNREVEKVEETEEKIEEKSTDIYKTD